MKLARFATCTSILLALSACGGTTIEEMYPEFLEGANTTSEMGGSALRVNLDTEAVETVRLTGSINHNSGALTVSDDQYSLVDPDGFDTDLIATDKDAALGLLVHADALNDYEYASVFEEIYTVDGVDYYLIGVGGIVTQEADMPTSGVAFYTGDAGGLGVDSLGTFELANGAADLTAYFGGAGQVDLVISGLMGYDSSTNPWNAGGIEITGMTIDGNTFTGGVANEQFEQINVGSDVDVFVDGTFFGFDDGIDAPDEVGGIILLTSTDAEIYLDFLAE